MTLNLSLTVNYHAPDVTEEELTRRLSQAIWNAVSRDLLVGIETESWVTDYTAQITRVDPPVEAFTKRSFFERKQ
jgi:20S proteasome alpha/beta subunit